LRAGGLVTPLEIGPTFRSSLAGALPTEKALSLFLQSRPAEWFQSELKSCERTVDHGVRKTVAAMANGRGGELFIGVSDANRSLCGSEIRQQELEQVLQQPLAPPGDWYVVDLRTVIGPPIPVSLTAAGRWAYVLEVAPSAVPVAVLEADSSLAIWAREGSSTVKLTGFSALRWSREASRERLLLGIYLEFRTMVRQIRISVNYDLRLGTGIWPRLPYLVRSLEDGSFYRLLSESDISKLLGRRSASGQGDESGCLARFLDLEERVALTQQRIASNGRPVHEVIRETIAELQDYPRQLEMDLEGLRQWLVGQHIMT
jgi:hypothetical protein